MTETLRNKVSHCFVFVSLEPPKSLVSHYALVAVLSLIYL